MNKFNLNIDKYTKKDLEEILDLSKTNYDVDIVEIKNNKIKNTILIDNTIDQITKKKLISFLNDAKAILVKGLTNKNSSSYNKNLSDIFDNVYNVDNKLKISNTTSAGETFITEPQKTPYIYSSPSEFFRGSLNPLDRRVINKSLTIDTRFRDNYTASQSSNYILDLPINFNNVVSMQLDSIEFPTTPFTFSGLTKSNFFHIIIDNVSQKIAIPNGNYTASALLDYLNVITAKLTAPFNSIVFTINLTDDNSGSGQMVIGIEEPNLPFNFILDFQADENGNPDHSTPLPLKMGWFMGFRNGIYENNSSYVSEGIVDVIGSRYIYLSIDEFCINKSDTFYSAYNNSVLNKNILARISIGGVGGSNNFVYQIQNNLSLINNKRYYYGPVDILKLQIQLLNEYGQIINLNNMDYSFALTLQTIYDL